MNSEQRCLEMSISRSNIVDQVAAFLYAIGVVYERDEVLNIVFGDMNADVVPIKVHFDRGVKTRTLG